MEEMMSEIESGEVRVPVQRGPTPRRRSNKSSKAGRSIKNAWVKATAGMERRPSLKVWVRSQPESFVLGRAWFAGKKMARSKPVRETRVKASSLKTDSDKGKGKSKQKAGGERAKANAGER